jgi:hypothetical protein
MGKKRMKNTLMVVMHVSYAKEEEEKRKHFTFFLSVLYT